MWKNLIVNFFLNYITYTSEKNVKRVGNIDSNERLIMMIGIGNLKDNYKVAISKKKDLNEIININ